MWNNFAVWAYLWATVFTATCILGQRQQQHFYRKPWPTYSLQNMPQTRFTCHDKILGGYYADSETQCQMFHVCVKVAGVGVQDFRFLCPNGTAFDQEAQICADWGDVDCEQSVLYYGSDNFDLYRIGSGFESKRAPLAEEEEATFHLQRAESADVRRSKETRVDQKSRPEQPPNYTKQFEAATTRNVYANHNYDNPNGHANQRNHQQVKSNDAVAVKKPIVNYYTPTTSTSTTTTTTTTTERSNSIDESKQEFDDIFKGSHSSHFFSNRNGGREDDFEYNSKPKANDITNFNKKFETSTAKSRAQATRSRRIQSTTSSTTQPPTTTTTAVPKSKKIISHTVYNADFLGANHNQKTTAAVSTTTTSTTTTTKAPSNANRFNLNADYYLTQEKIQPTTYNPSNSIYRLKTTPTPKYNELNRESSSKNLEKSLSYSKPTASARKTQSKVGPRNSTFVNQNEFTEFTKIKVEQPKPFQPVQTFRAPPVASTVRSHNQEPQYFRNRVGNQDPAPFSAPQKPQQKPQQKQKQNESTTTRSRTASTVPELTPRGFTNRGSINYKASTQREALESFTQTTTQTVKKFSTIVPKDLYTPTTYKPTSPKGSNNNDYNYYLTQQTVRPANKPQKPFTTTTTTPAAPTTANPYYNADEDDGQYHPELYEVDFPRNRLNIQRSSSTTTKQPYAFNHRLDVSPQSHLKTQQLTAFQKQQEKEKATPVDLSDEEELFKTAHSLNFGAASINKLRADIIKAEKTSQQYNSQYVPNLVQSSSPKVTAPAPSTTTSTTTYFTYPTTHSTTAVANSKSTQTSTTPFQTTTTTTTKRPFTYLPTSSHSTTTKRYDNHKPTKTSKSGKSKGKKATAKGGSSKRPPHADEDTSYDYAYYDTDTLSESPQEYPEYEISEFVKTRKN